MKKCRSRSDGHTFAAKQKAMLAVLVAVALLDCAVCMVSVREMNRETSMQMSRIARMQIDQTYQECSKISYDMRRLLMENQDMTTLAVNGTKREQIYAKGKLVEKLMYSFADREEYHPLFYFEKTEELLGASQIRLEDAKESGIVNTILQKIKEEEKEVLNLYRFEQFELDGTYYMLRTYCYNEVWFFCYVPASAMISSLETIYDGESTSAVLLGTEGEVLAGGEAIFTNTNRQELSEGGIFYQFPWKRMQIVTEKSKELNLSIAVIMSGYGGFSRILIIQGIVLFMVLVTLISFLLLMVYTKRHIILPVQKFIKGVTCYGEKEGDIELSGNDILELEQINKQFRGFVQQIKDLKIDIYEQEIMQQKLEMDNMKLQLKPHFFLNTLGMVVSLLQNERSKDAIEMCQATVRYLRYLFHAGLDETAIWEVMEHIEDYFKIMKLRYPGEVEMDLYVEQEAAGYMLPPLMIQTLVENCFKYAKSEDRILEVSVTITIERMQEEEYLCVNVSDNGPGYQADYISLWENGKDLPRQGGKHIGMANLKARLQYAYENKAAVKFYNSPMGGAVTEIGIPLQLARKEKSDEHIACR